MLELAGAMIGVGTVGIVILAVTVAFWAAIAYGVWCLIKAVFKKK